MSQKKVRDTSPATESSSLPAKSDGILTPPSTSSTTPQRSTATSASTLSVERVFNTARMEKDKKDEEEGRSETLNTPSSSQNDGSDGQESRKKEDDKEAVKESAADSSKAAGSSNTAASKKKAKKCGKHVVKDNKKGTKAKKKQSKPAPEDSSDSDSDSSSSSSSSASSDSDSDMEEYKAKLKKKLKAKAKKKAQKKEKKARKHKKRKRYDSSDDESSDSESEASDSSSDESSSDSSSEDSDHKERSSRRRRSGKKGKRRSTPSEDSAVEDEVAVPVPIVTGTATADAEALARLQTELNTLVLNVQARQIQEATATQARTIIPIPDPGVVVIEAGGSRKHGKKGKKKDGKEKKTKKASTLEFKRVDQLWDNNIHDWKISESAEDQGDQFDEYIFTVRRCFNWENKYRNTLIDIKSKLLREALQDIMKDVKSVSLVEEQPCVDPNMLFLYLEETRTYYKKTLNARIKKEKKRKQIKHLKAMRSHVKVLLRYIDEDYADTKKTLYPLLEAGNITFDLLWALFKPNSLAFTQTYGSADDPRCFLVDYANKESSFVKGEWYSIEGRYLEYDGKHFGLGDIESTVDQFKGPRKISSLATYPLQYHKEPEKVKERLLDRGKKFVMMQGMNYRFHKGLAFQKIKRTIRKVNINGRVMIDPANFRRLNPNYPVSIIKRKDPDVFSDDEDSECSDCGCGSDDDRDDKDETDELDKGPKTAWKIFWDSEDKPHLVKVEIDENGDFIKPENLEPLPNTAEKDGAKSPQAFTEEELLIASPVVLGFSLGDKSWMEFSLSGINEIEWNEGAFESLVLPANQKSIVNALVSSHKFHAAETIDDVVQGKGKGKVFVLHGPPGVGKTLTAEGIAEMLRCPLYAVSAGDLGTDHRMLESELQRIMDIAHSWGAVLLLDEADVFLEKRQIHDIGRNALVSIFLRLLEYFQGILFLTTNRVETFDEAFQSRIHVALRYEELGHRAKKDIWRMFLGKVRRMETENDAAAAAAAAAAAGKKKDSSSTASESSPLAPPSPPSFSERDYELLARNNLNGRQIKNTVLTAQALAVNEKTKLNMEHIERVLAVAESFERDLKGLTLDAMKSYI